MRPSARTRTATALLLGLLVVLLLPVARLDSATAVNVPADISIDVVTPAVPRATDVLTIEGHVANTGDVDLAAPAVQLRFSPLPLNSRQEVLQVFNGTTDRTGNAVPDTLVPLPATLVPGQQAPFALRVPLAELGLPADSAGAYAAFVEVLTDGGTVATEATAFPWFPPAAEFQPSELALLWPVVQQPAVAAEELVTQPALPNEFLPSGRLSRLLDAGEEHNVSWLVDSATLSAAHDMADGYQIPGPDGPQPGDKAAGAGAFAEQLQSLLTRKRHTTLPQYAIADDDALQRAGLEAFVVRSATLPAVLRDQLTPEADARVAALAAGGTTDAITLETLVDAGVRRFMLVDEHLPPDPELSYTPSGVATMTIAGTEVTVLLTDHLLDRTLARPLTTAAERTRARQQLLVDTALITLERPAEPRRVIASPPLLWNPPTPWVRSVLKQLDRASWLRLVGVDRVAGAPAPTRVGLSYGEVAQRRELPPEYVERIAAAADQLARLSRVLSEPAGSQDTYTLALQRAGSALWRDDPAARDAFLTTVERQVQEQLASVRVVSSGTVTLAGESGVVPLTVANDLDQTVTVGLQLATDNPVRLQYTPPEPVRIAANQKAGLEVPVRVAGSQPMTVRVVLTDADGGFYDDSASLELRSTAANRIATIVVGVGAVALVSLVVLNLIRRRRNPPEHDPGRDEALADQHA